MAKYDLTGAEKDFEDGNLTEQQKIIVKKNYFFLLLLANVLYVHLYMQDYQINI